MKRHRFTRYLTVVGAVFLALPTAGRGQAFGINEIGTCAAARAFAVTGAPCQDASSIFWNPGKSAPTGKRLLAGAAVIVIGGAFTQDTTFREYEGDVPTAIVPHAFLSYRRPNSRFSYGLGVYVPYGLTSQWTDSFPGRFVAKKAALATLYVQPNFSYEINDKFSVGGGPVIGHSSVELIQALDLSEQVASAGPPLVRFSNLGIASRTEFGRATLTGDAFAYGAHIGFYAKPYANWQMGIRFLTPLEFEYKGAEATFRQTNTGLVLPAANPITPGTPVNVDALVAAQFTGTGALTTQEVETRITHPAQIQGGVGYSGFTNWLISVDYAWTGWRRFKEIPLTFKGPAAANSRVLIQDYNNTSALRMGVQRSFASGASLRAGWSGVASAAPDETVTPLLPEQDRAYGSIGGEWPFMKNWAIEGTYLKVMAPGKRGRIVERGSRSQTATQVNTGVYTLDAHVFSFSIKGNF